MRVKLGFADSGSARQTATEDKMDAAALAEEYRLALEEHTRALALVKEMRDKVEAARVEVEQARTNERHYEQEMERSAEQLTKAIQGLQVEETRPLLPVVTDYLVEYNANIGCYHCYVFVGDGVVDTSMLSVGVDLTKVSFSYASNPWWSVELERKVDAENCSIVAKDDHIYIRLPVNPSDKETVDGFSSFSQTAPHELQVESYASLSCRSCGSMLMEDAQRMEKVLPLPSENWMEMFDFWGAGIGSFEHIPREGIFAHERRVYVGESHILLHEGDLKAQALINTESQKAKSAKEEDEEAEEQDWENVSCAACRVIIGDRRVENPITIRLQKHLISATRSGGDAGVPENVFDRYTIDSTISAQMLHVAESDGIFRFLLRSTPANGTDEAEPNCQGLQLQLLSWDAKIQQSSSSDFHRVLKVVYSTGPGASVSPAAQAELPPMLRTHELLVTPAIGAEIASRLEKSSLLLPPSQRTFNKMTVGYLYA